MAIQFSTTLRNNRLDQIESTTGTTAKLYFFTGSPPANCAAVDSGTQIGVLTLPSDWMAAAASGSKALAGTWTGTASAAGTIGHFRLKDNAGTTTHVQGTVTITGSGGDMTLDNNVVANGQTISITSFTVTDGNA